MWPEQNFDNKNQTPFFFSSSLQYQIEICGAGLEQFILKHYQGSSPNSAHIK